MPFVKRTIEIHFNSDKMLFPANTLEESKLSDQQYNEFIKALGYMVWYGMSNSEKDSDVRGGIQIGKDMGDVEICLNYRDADAPSTAQGFTMAAVSRENGTKYTTHS
jgi:hypothetical protein